MHYGTIKIYLEYFTRIYKYINGDKDQLKFIQPNLFVDSIIHLITIMIPSVLIYKVFSIIDILVKTQKEYALVDIEAIIKLDNNKINYPVLSAFNLFITMINKIY
jgi:hypothetical protein